MRVYALLICMCAFWKHTSDKPAKFMVEYSRKYGHCPSDG